MYRLISVFALAAGCAASAFAQDTIPATTPLPSAPQPARYAAVPFVNIAVGFTYLQTDLTDTDGGTGTYQMGWYGMPQVFLTRHISAIADFSNYSNYHAHQTDNVHTFLGGPAYTLGTFHGLQPFGFVEGGAIRESTDGAVNWNPAASGGVGVNMKLTHAISFQVIPGQYVAEKLPNGNWQSDYVAKAGFVLNTFRWARVK